MVALQGRHGSAIAGLACGEKVLERLSRERVGKVAWLLELAVAGRISQRTLAGAVTRASRRYDVGRVRRSSRLGGRARWLHACDMARPVYRSA